MLPFSVCNLHVTLIAYWRVSPDKSRGKTQMYVSDSFWECSLAHDKLIIFFSETDIFPQETEEKQNYNLGQ